MMLTIEQVTYVREWAMSGNGWRPVWKCRGFPMDALRERWGGTDGNEMCLNSAGLTIAALADALGERKLEELLVASGEENFSLEKSIDAPPPDDLTRAQELLREWMEAANIAEEHRALPVAQLCWEDGHGWYASLEWPVNDARLGWHTVSGPGPSGPNPLDAVRAAIAASPWAGVENK